MKKLISCLLCLVMLCGCAPGPSDPTQYSATFLTLFDTVTTITGFADSEEAFQAMVQPIYEELQQYHQLFDIYQEYDGVHNLKTINDRAGVSAVQVNPLILELLQDCKGWYSATNGKCNAALGSVLHLWHEAREAGIQDPLHARLPDSAALEEASRHINPEDIILDWEASTVFLADPMLRLDVGAIAKGWSVQRVCENAPSGLLVSVGGNVCATGPKDAHGTPWVVGIQNPDGGNHHLHTLNIASGSVVTSGSYQRSYTVDGKLYHHIIDPDTLYPGEYWTSVTVICDDSGLADMLSTALFLINREDGQQLLDRFDAHAMWVDPQQRQYYSPGFQDFIRS